MRGRRVLVTGGGKGTGRAAIRELHRLGAEVIVGTRQADRYAEIERELGGERVHPFLADITDREATGRQLAALADRGLHPTDVVHSAAGGLEPVLRPLMRSLVRLRKAPEDRRSAAVEGFLAELRSLIPPTRDLGFLINFEAARDLTEGLLPGLPTGGRVVFYSSLWSSFHGRVPTPAFYSVVGSSKLAFEDWLAANAPAWRVQDISTVILSGHLIIDTQLGEVIDRYLVPLLPRQDSVRSSFISSTDMVRATVMALTQPVPRDPWRLYVIGPGGQMVEDLPADAPALLEAAMFPDPTEGLAHPAPTTLS